MQCAVQHVSRRRLAGQCVELVGEDVHGSDSAVAARREPVSIGMCGWRETGRSRRDDREKAWHFRLVIAMLTQLESSQLQLAHTTPPTP